MILLSSECLTYLNKNYNKKMIDKIKYLKNKLKINKNKNQNINMQYNFKIKFRMCIWMLQR